MSLLTDTDIKELICTDKVWEDQNEKIHIYPFAEESLTPIGYDLRVGNLYSTTSNTGPFELKENDSIFIEPRDTALITTLETIDMPKNRWISALILSKVSQVSKGLSHISTTIDPDWNGHLLIAVHNHSKNKIELNFGDAFCTVVFLKNKSPSTKICDKYPGRLDVFINEWSSKARKAKSKERFIIWISPGIIFLSVALGYYLFGNSSGFIATVAAGVALSQIIRSYLN